MAFSIYKRSQGTYTRLYSAFGLAIIAGLGCLRLYEKLQAADFGLGPKGTLWVATMVPTGLFVVLSLFIFWLVNKPSIADFMVVAEGEMKKVSWSSRKEIAVSTFVVIVTVIIVALLLGFFDFTFELIFGWLLR